MNKKTTILLLIISICVIIGIIAFRNSERRYEEMRSALINEAMEAMEIYKKEFYDKYSFFEELELLTTDYYSVKRDYNQHGPIIKYSIYSKYSTKDRMSGNTTPEDFKRKYPEIYEFSMCLNDPNFIFRGFGVIDDTIYVWCPRIYKDNGWGVEISISKNYISGYSYIEELDFGWQIGYTIYAPA